MFNVHRDKLADKASPKKLRAAGWINRVPSESIDARLNPGVGHRAGWMLLILESYCRVRRYCWSSNAELAAAYGCTERALQMLLGEMEGDDLVRRVLTDHGRPGRVGIVLLRRLNPAMPVATEADLADVVREMMADAEASSTKKTAPSARRKLRPSRTKKTSCGIKTLSLNKDELKNDRDAVAFASASPSPEIEHPGPSVPDAEEEIRFSSTTTTTDASPVSYDTPSTDATLPESEEATTLQDGITAPHPPLSAPPPAPELQAACCAPDEVHPCTACATAPPMTPGQEQWLASLSADRRQTFDALPAEGRAGILAPHRLGFDRIIAAEQAKALGPKIANVPPPAMPTTTKDLWANLTGGPREWVQHAANDLMRDFGDPGFRPAYEQLAAAVWEGTIDASKVVDAHRQAMKPESKKPGAVFNTALKRHKILWEGSRP